ncbi:hypothetical protein GOP47_0000341 [Adiantum capillus-veneris]|uniref:Uncharacterized protein n=1 Tax=Adiantum capillus-veneris TaxID=13818 RepID=A0A9D4ZST0_ADICA|nr:hypothetical protein GOP47_0000341 [Adiantum capillus-veneris]
MELGIPAVFFWSQSAAVFSIYRHVPLLDANGFFPFNKESPGPECKEDDARLVSYIPGVSPLYPEDLPTFLLVEDRSDKHLKFMELQFDLLKECKTVVINSFYELEKETFDALQGESLSVYAVGPLLSSKQTVGSSKHVANFCRTVQQDGVESIKRDECLRWLDTQSMQSVLYISFGTLVSPDPENMKGIALALRESKQPFVWAFKLTSFYDHLSGEYKGISSVAEMLPEHFLEDTVDYGILVPWAPQQDVLAHPSVGASLIHCGWNSTLESVSMGVPIIPLPMASDQTTNSKYVIDVWKVGVRLELNKSGKVDSADLIRVLNVVFHEEEGQELRKRAGKLKEAARRKFEIRSKNDMHRFCEALMHTIA